MKKSWENICNILASPRTAFNNLKLQARWKTAFLLFCLFQIGITWGTSPFEAQLVAISTGMPVSSASANALWTAFAVISCLVTPIWCAIQAALLTGVARVCKVPETVKFQHIYASLIHISLILAFVDFINAGLLTVFRGVTEIQTHADMQMIPGLHHLIGDMSHVKILIFLSEINLLSLWHIAILTIAIMVFAEAKRLPAFFSATAIWLVGVIISTTL